MSQRTGAMSSRRSIGQSGPSIISLTGPKPAAHFVTLKTNSSCSEKVKEPGSLDGFWFQPSRHSIVPLDSLSDPESPIGIAISYQSLSAPAIIRNASHDTIAAIDNRRVRVGLFMRSGRLYFDRHFEGRRSGLCIRRAERSRSRRRRATWAALPRQIQTHRIRRKGNGLVTPLGGARM